MTLSLLQTSSGDNDHILSAVNGGGDCLYSLPVSCITLNKCRYRYRGACWSRKEKIVLKIVREKEKNVLWASEEDINVWNEIITIYQA